MILFKKFKLNNENFNNSTKNEFKRLPGKVLEKIEGIPLVIL